jgi:hypothetical protein
MGVEFACGGVNLKYRSFPMIRSRVRQLTNAALALTLAFAAVAANATIYRGSYDPLFGPPLLNPDIGWRGESQFSIGTACFEGGAARTIVNTASIAGCSATVEGSRIEFYVAGQAELPTLASVTFLQDIAITEFFYDLADGKPVIREIEASLTPFQFAVDENTEDDYSLEDLFGNNPYSFALQFDLTSSADDLNTSGFNPRAANGPLLFARQRVDCETCYIDIASLNRPTTFVLSEGTAGFDVPEPGSLALVAGALGLAGFARRRRVRA